MITTISRTLELAIVAISNLMLVIEYCWVSGWLIGQSSIKSASWWWGIVAFLIAFSSFIGGINHVFFELSHQNIYAFLYLLTLISIGATALGLGYAACIYFIQKKSTKILMIGVFLANFVIYSISVCILSNGECSSKYAVTHWMANHIYALAILDYLFNLVVLAGLNSLHWQTKGSVHIYTFCAIVLIASMIQQTHLIFFDGLLDHDSLYHLISMISGLSFLYAGKKMILPKKIGHIAK